MIHVQLIGPPAVTCEGARCASLSAPQAVTLLALLILEAKPEVSRAQLGATLWPRHGEVERQGNLRVALHRLRAAWPRSGEALVIHRTAVSWRDPSLVRSDLDTLGELLAQPVSVAALGQLRALLGGALMEGHNARWVQAHRRQLQQRLQDWLTRALPPLTASQTPALGELRAALQAPPQDPEGWRQLLSLVTEAVVAPRHGATIPASELGSLGVEERALVCAALEAQAERLTAAGLRGEAQRSRALAARLSPPSAVAPPPKEWAEVGALGLDLRG